MIPKKSFIPRAPLNNYPCGCGAPTKWKDFPNHNISVLPGLYIRCIGGLTHSTSKMINLNIRGFSLKCVFLTSNEEVVTEAQWSRVQVGKMLNLK